MRFCCFSDTKKETHLQGFPFEIERREERIHTEMKKIREQRRDAKKK